jgi:uracil-DNA glycosylase
MIEPGASEPGGGDLFDELSEFLECLSAHLEWHREVGTLGLPRDSGAKARVEAAYAEAGWGPRSVEARPVEARPTERARPMESAKAELPAAAGFEASPPPRARTPGPVARSEVAREAPVRGHLPIVDAKIAAASLEELERMVKGCQACGLHADRKQAVFARGTGESKICFVGEGPGADEDEQGEPFVGAAGQLLDKMILAMGLSRDEVYICNVVKCRPPNNRKPEPDETAACAGYLARQLELIAPEAIVALGGTAVAGLLGITDGITRIRGTFRLYQGRIPVMPTFHPAYLLRTPSAKREVWADLKAVLQHVGRKAPRAE